jgi:methylase of polypeptide subunit release factors
LQLVARDEAGREPPYGPALDLGTGSGDWGVQLAKRGWRVTGVEDADTEPDALARLFRFNERFYRLRRNGTTV